jgi:hypothetical protein
MECPQCGTTIEVDVNGMGKSARVVDRGLAQLDRQFGKLGG